MSCMQWFVSTTVTIQVEVGGLHTEQIYVYASYVVICLDCAPSDSHWTSSCSQFQVSHVYFQEIKDIPSSAREAFYLCLNWTSPSCEWNCCARSTHKSKVQDHHCEIETVDLSSRLLSRGWYSWSKVTIITFLFSFVFEYFVVPCGKLESPCLGKAQQPQEQRCPFLSACEVFSCVQTMITELCQCLGFLMCAQMWMYVSAHRHGIRVFTGSWLLEKNPLLHQGLEPTSVLCLAFQSDSLPTGRSCPTPLEARVPSWEWHSWSITITVTIMRVKVFMQDHCHEDETFEARPPSWKWNFGSWTTIVKMELWKLDHHRENGTLEAGPPSWKSNFGSWTTIMKMELWKQDHHEENRSKITIVKIELWKQDHHRENGTLEAGPPWGEQKQNHHHNNRTFGATSPSWNKD